MQRVSVIKRVSSLATLRCGYNVNVQKRYLATVKEVFPHKTDFPSRHIGPRKTEVVAMLDYIGFKVRQFGPIGRFSSLWRHISFILTIFAIVSIDSIVSFV